jgi:restriction system protein
MAQIMEAPMLVRLSAGVPHARPTLNEAAVGRERLRLLTWIVSIATIFFVLWGLWLYGVAAEAAGRWPEWVVELLGLLTGAGLLTLIVLWSLVFWQRRRTARSPVGARMTVEQLYALSPRAFEHFVAELFERRGYTVEVRGRAGDLGVDLVIRGPDSRLAIVQCKRYRHQIGPDIVRELFGTMVHERAIHGFLVTTAGISEAARQWAADKPITLIDGQALSELSDDLRA